MKYFTSASLFLVCVILSLQHALVLGLFQVQVRNKENNVYNISCSFVAQTNAYGTSIKTTTVPENWEYVTGNEYNLRFDRVDSTHANGELV